MSPCHHRTMHTSSQPRRHALLLIAGAAFMAIAPACDPAPDDSLDPELLLDEDFDAADELVSEAAPAVSPQALQAETFVFSIPGDMISVTNASDGVWAGYPAGIPALDEPEISDGFTGTVKLHDAMGNLVGFGTKQSVTQGTGAESTFALTIPGRGTIMLSEDEDFPLYYTEIADMIADGELVRSFDPPLVVTTAPGAGKIIGGTGEFANAHGTYQGTQSVYQFDLINRIHDMTYVIELSPNGDEG